MPRIVNRGRRTGLRLARCSAPLLRWRGGTASAPAATAPPRASGDSCRSWRQDGGCCFPTLPGHGGSDGCRTRRHRRDPPICWPPCAPTRRSARSTSSAAAEARDDRPPARPAPARARSAARAGRAGGRSSAGLPGARPVRWPVSGLELAAASSGAPLRVGCGLRARRCSRSGRTRAQPSCATSSPEEAAPRHSSGCADSNSGPLRPERSALPGCATPRARTG